MTGACHAPVDGREGKALADTDPNASPVPSKNPQIWRWMAERISKFSLPVGGSIEANSIAERMSVTAAFEDLDTTPKPEKASRLPQKPHTPSESPRYFAAVG